MYVVFSTTNKILSRLIRWFDKSRASHTAVMFDDLWLIEAHIMGVRANWWSKFRKGNDIVGVYRLGGINRRVLDSVIEDVKDEYTDYSYDYLGLLGKGWITFRRYFIDGLFGNPLDRPGAVDCVEFTGAVLKRISEKTEISIVPPFDPSVTGVKDMRRMVSNSPYFREVDPDEIRCIL